MSSETGGRWVRSLAFRSDMYFLLDGELGPLQPDFGSEQGHPRGNHASRYPLTQLARKGQGAGFDDAKCVSPLPSFL